MKVRIEFEKPMAQYIKLNDHQESLWKAYTDASEAIDRVGWYHEDDATYRAANAAWDAFVESINLYDIDLEELINGIHEVKW